MPNLNSLTAQDVMWGSANWSGMRNLLINALGQINQRGYVSGTATTAANQYTVDRWKVLVSGQNVTWTTANGVATFTAPAGGFAQVVEAANVQGGNYVLSWSGTATVTVNGNPVTSGVPFNLAPNANAFVVFSNGTFTMPQLERGAFPTQFDWRSSAVELLLAKRYYERFSADNLYNLQISFVASAAGQNGVSTCVFSSEKRAIPSMSSGGGAFNFINCSSIGFVAGKRAFSSYITSLASGITQVSANATTCYWDADAEL